MKTNFNWGMFFTVLLVIACIYCAFYGMLTALTTESWTPMWWITPGALLIAGYFAKEEGDNDQRYCYFQKQEEEIERHETRIHYLECKMEDVEERLSEIDERLDS